MTNRKLLDVRIQIPVHVDSESCLHHDYEDFLPGGIEFKKSMMGELSS